jgi:hypothetical protein
VGAKRVGRGRRSKTERINLIMEHAPVREEENKKDRVGYGWGEKGA